MKQILEQFLVRIDENGKEVESYDISTLTSDTKTYPNLDLSDLATEVIKLPTLSEFIKSHKLSNGMFHAETLGLNVVSYNGFLQQPLTKEMFIGEDAIFYNNKGSETIAVYNLYSTIGEALNDKVTLYLNPDKI